MQVFVNAINNDNAKDKWNTAIASIKKNLHSLSNGLNVAALNRVWAQFVKSYNRMINLLYELDRKYGQFQVPSPTYYDEIPAVPLTTYKDFAVAVNLVFANINKIPKLNNPVLQIQNMAGQLEADFRDFTRSYVATANKESATIKTQQRDREGHVTAFQNYIAKANSYATAEQREIAQEYMESVYEGDLTTTATQGAEILEDIITAIDDTIEAVREARDRNGRSSTTTSTTTVDPGTGGITEPTDPGTTDPGTGTTTDTGVDEALEKLKKDAEEAKDKAQAAAEGRAEAKEALDKANQAYQEARDRFRETTQAMKEANDDLKSACQAAFPEGGKVEIGDYSVDFTRSDGSTVSYDGRYNYASDSSTEKVYEYNETTGKWTNVEDPTDTASDALSDVFDSMKNWDEAYKDDTQAKTDVVNAANERSKANSAYNAADAEYKEATDAANKAESAVDNYSSGTE